MSDHDNRPMDDERAHEADETHHADKDNLGVDGATQGAAASGAGGGMGASAGLGGFGAGGPVGATPEPSADVTDPASGRNVRTEYEMGHEYDPEHEKVAESGLFAQRAGEAVVDTWRSPDDEERDPAK